MGYEHGGLTSGPVLRYRLHDTGACANEAQALPLLAGHFRPNDRQQCKSYTFLLVRV